ncbi:cytochrome d ubiquinol oxidase subunit II [Candidatus Neptunichlamydia sp. REUL1]|uniref:cytochrome d ubiquinol oxidase subunit II n=1 Tax=Candidatus Neptunichlamydia sp. REUL1 TaxID=3064277 RepID=UPI0029308E4E|nr:cytochrome d ubiquinol oxidase subunit II [Candidatus Neptunochlamydia sp. REUL1]
MLLETFQVIWYAVIGISVIMYTVLDGFDLGVGCLHLFTRSDQERRLMLNAIGPVWDGNEVWLIIVFGAMFVGFPPVYATICSAFYFIIMILLMGLMIRAVAIEFRSKQESKGWRRFWDCMFSIGSYVIAFTIGVLMGNIIVGVPIDQNEVFQGSFAGFFTPYTILVGILGVTVFMMHGAIYMLMKTEGTMHERVRRWVNPTIIIFIICYIATTIVTLVYKPHMTDLMRQTPALFLAGVLALLAIICVPLCTCRGKDGTAFIFSSISITLLFILFGLGTYPNMVRSSLDPSYSLTLFNSSATVATFKVVLIMAGIGVPMALAYGYWMYRIFRGKVSIDETSY